MTRQVLRPGEEMLVLHERPAPEVLAVIPERFPVSSRDTGPDFKDSAALNAPALESTLLIGAQRWALQVRVEILVEQYRNSAERFPAKLEIFLPNSHQNSHTTRNKNGSLLGRLVSY